MRILIDAMGGDNAPGCVIEGVCRARDEFGDKAALTLVGDTEKIKACAAERSLSLDGIDIVHTDSVIGMEENPMAIAKGKKECSMAVGLKMLTPAGIGRNKYGVSGDAFVSAGSTGALHMGSSLFVPRLRGVRRSCIAVVMPFSKPVLLLDSGANPDAREDYLYQWALVGSAYMEAVMGVKSPRVGLLNNGTEESKGNEVSVAAHKLLSESRLNFIGNIEAREIPFGAADVIVCDGFTGNVVLKLSEGMGKYMFSLLREMFSSSVKGKLAYLLVKPELRRLKRGLDSSEQGGAPLLGLEKTVIKAHGSSDGKAIYNAIRQAIICVENDVMQTMKAALGDVGVGDGGDD